jgi:ketopantoate reductase
VQRHFEADFFHFPGFFLPIFTQTSQTNVSHHSIHDCTVSCVSTANPYLYITPISMYTIQTSWIYFLMTLHILGGGSIGLLYASSMRLACRRKFPVCLLLQPHHERKMRSYKNPGEIKQKSDTNREETMSARNRNSVHENNLPVNNRYVSVEMKDFHGNVHLQNIPSEIIHKNGNDNDKQDIRNILLATKAPHAVPALESIVPRFHPTEQINLVIMSNGSLSIVDEIQQRLHEKGIGEKVNIIYASTTHGAIRGADIHIGDRCSRQSQNENLCAFSVTWTGVGHTFIQESGHADSTNQDNLQQRLHETWNEVGLKNVLTNLTDMYILNWKKFATNCAINPLTALRQCQNGDLLAEQLDRPSYEETFDYSNFMPTCTDTDARLFYQLIREVSDVAKAEAEKCSDAIMDVSFVKNELSYENVSRFVENVVHQTSRNKSSMLQDIIARRYPTEIMHLNGYVSKLGHECHGLELKANTYISTEVERQSRRNSI